MQVFWLIDEPSSRIFLLIFTSNLLLRSDKWLLLVVAIKMNFQKSICRFTGCPTWICSIFESYIYCGQINDWIKLPISKLLSARKIPILNFFEGKKIIDNFLGKWKKLVCFWNSKFMFFLMELFYPSNIYHVQNISLKSNQSILQSQTLNKLFKLPKQMWVQRKFR